MLFTLASLDTAAMSTSGVRGGWGEGPTTIAPTRQQLSAGRELGRFADGGAAAGTISSAVAAFAASTSVFARIGATTDVADGDVTGGGVQTADLRAEIEHREGERAAAARGEDRGRMHNMVSRSIFPGPMGEVCFLVLSAAGLGQHECLLVVFCEATCTHLTLYHASCIVVLRLVKESDG